jgi:hypothetical protein
LLVAAIAFDLRIHSSLGIWRQNTFNDTGKARTEDLQRKLFTLSALPRVANGAGAGIGRGVASSETPLASRSSTPAEVSAEFFAGVAPLTTKLAPGSVWNAPEAKTLTCSWRR